MGVLLLHTAQPRRVAVARAHPWPNRTEYPLPGRQEDVTQRVGVAEVRIRMVAAVWQRTVT